jgi:hypothetical protein
MGSIPILNTNYWKLNSNGDEARLLSVAFGIRPWIQFDPDNFRRNPSVKAVRLEARLTFGKDQRMAP